MMDDVLTLIRKEAQVLKSDRSVVIFLFAFPLVFTLLLSEGFGKMLGTDRGIDSTMPGFTVMFGFYVITFLGMSHYREHYWGSWITLRSLGLSRGAIILGTLAPYYLLGIIQMGLMLFLGWSLFGMQVSGSLFAIALLILATGLTTMGIALTLLNLTSQLSTMEHINHLVVLVLGTIGGTLLPPAVMPAWARPLAPFTPQYWAVQGFRAALSEQATVSDVLPNLAILLGMGGVLLAVGIPSFDLRRQRQMRLR